MPRTRSRALSAARCRARPPSTGLPSAARRVADLLLQRVEVRADVVFHRASRTRSAVPLQRAARVADLLAHALVADAAGRLVELARRVLLVAPRLVGELLELLLQLADLRVHRVLALRELLRLAAAARRRPACSRPLTSDATSFCSFGELLGLPLRVLRCRARARPPWFRSSFCCASRSLSSAAVRLRAAVLRCRWPPPAASRCAASCSCRAASARSCRCCSRVSCSSRRAASSSFLGELALAAAAAAAAAAAGRRPPCRRCRSASCCCRRASSFSFSASSSTCWSLALLLGALLHLVLVRQLVELELEQVGQVLGHLALLAAAATAAAALLRRPASRTPARRPAGASARAARATALPSPSAPCRSPSAVFISADGLRQRLGDRLEAPDRRRRAALFSLPTSSSTCSRSFACARLRNTTFSRNLSGRQLRLVADDVERRGDDLPLLLARAGRPVAAAAAAAARRPATAPACSPCWNGRICTK